MASKKFSNLVMYMLTRRKHKLIAGFLLTVFSVAPVLGFACSIDPSLGYNAKHHEADVEAVVHIHEDGENHIHYEKKKANNHGGHAAPATLVNVSKRPGKDQPAESNCCTEEVTDLGEIDKSLPPSHTIKIPIFITGYTDAFYTNTLPGTDLVKNIKQFLRGYHPPILNIRIAIQSFQI
jgi:hypothetical protein